MNNNCLIISTSSNNKSIANQIIIIIRKNYSPIFKLMLFKVVIFGKKRFVRIMNF